VDLLLTNFILCPDSVWDFPVSAKKGKYPPLAELKKRTSMLFLAQSKVLSSYSFMDSSMAGKIQQVKSRKHKYFA